MKKIIFIILLVFSNISCGSDKVKMYIGSADDSYETVLNEIHETSHDSVLNSYFMITIELNIDNARMIEIKDTNYINKICRNDNKGEVVYYSYSDKPLGKRKITVMVHYDPCLTKDSAKAVLGLKVVGSDGKKYYNSLDISIIGATRVRKNKKRLQ